MINKKQSFICGILIAVLSIVVLSGCAQDNKPSTQTDNLLVEYHYTSEGSYFDAQISGSKLTYVHTDDEKIKDKCARWLQQTPCWTQDDLITEEAALTSAEVEELTNLVEESKVLELEDYYGPKNERCYPQILTIQSGNEAEKTITYCVGFGGSTPDMPKAFEEVSQKITELVSQKFPG